MMRFVRRIIFELRTSQRSFFLSQMESNKKKMTKRSLAFNKNDVTIALDAVFAGKFESLETERIVRNQYCVINMLQHVELSPREYISLVLENKLPYLIISFQLKVETTEVYIAMQKMDSLHDISLLQRSFSPACVKDLEFIRRHAATFRERCFADFVLHTVTTNGVLTDPKTLRKFAWKRWFVCDEYIPQWNAKRKEKGKLCLDELWVFLVFNAMESMGCRHIPKEVQKKIACYF